MSLPDVIMSVLCSQAFNGAPLPKRLNKLLGLGFSPVIADQI